MLRNVYLEGTMGQEFGTKFQIYAETVHDALRCLEANMGDKFRKYLINCHEDETGFLVDVADNAIDYEAEMLMPMHEGDITITPMPEGSKSAFGKILAAIVIITLALTPPGQALLAKMAAGLNAIGLTAVTLEGLTLSVVMIGVNIGLAGIMQMMAPDPSVDQDQQTNYLFNGPEQNVIQGDPVPVLYGKLRVPGQPVNFEVSPVNSRARAAGFNEDGSTFSIDTSAIFDAPGSA